jgi:hypothetical protein
MKRFVLSIALMLGVVSSASAVTRCWPQSEVYASSLQYLSATYLSNWWNYYGVPAGVEKPHSYVASSAADQHCRAQYGPTSWAVVVGPTSLTVDGNIWGGVYFHCKRCGEAEPQPGPITPRTR